MAHSSLPAPPRSFSSFLCWKLCVPSSKELEQRKLLLSAVMVGGSVVSKEGGVDDVKDWGLAVGIPLEKGTCHQVLHLNPSSLTHPVNCILQGQNEYAFCLQKERLFAIHMDLSTPTFLMQCLPFSGDLSWVQITARDFSHMWLS